MGIVNNIHKSKVQIVALFSIVAFVILSTTGFHYLNWNPIYGGWISNVVSFALLLFLMTRRKCKSQCHFNTEIMLLIFIPFFSIFNSWTIYSQMPNRSFIALLGQFTWVIYFVLHRYKVSEETILKALLYISLFVVAVQIIQQFTYPIAPFGTKSEDDMLENHLLESAEQRNGLWRFRMHFNAFYTAPVLFALWIKLRQKISMKLLVIVALLFVSVYLTLTRQVMVACLLAIFCSSFMGKRKVNMPILIIGLLLLWGLYMFYDVLFSSLAEQTQEESLEDNVRILAATILWDESIRTPFTFLWGHGLPDPSSQYGIHMFRLSTSLGVYASDIGFIGQIFERGFLYVCVCYYMMMRVFFKYKKVIPLYIRMFVLFTGTMSIMIFPCMAPHQFIVWVLLLYICDLYINKSPLVAK